MPSASVRIILGNSAMRSLALGTSADRELFLSETRWTWTSAIGWRVCPSTTRPSIRGEEYGVSERERQPVATTNNTASRQYPMAGVVHERIAVRIVTCRRILRFRSGTRKQD